MCDNAWKSQMYPLIDRIEQSDSSVYAHRTFSVSQDEFLNQHRLNGVPLMPGVGFLEFMAEFHGSLEIPKTGVCFKNVSFHDAFKLYRDEPRETYIQAEKTKNTGEWAMKIHAAFTSKLSKVPQFRDYSGAIVSTGEFVPPSISPDEWQLTNAKHLYAEEVFSQLDNIPQNVIFGPLFNDIRRSTDQGTTPIISWAEEGLINNYRFPQAQIDNPLYPLESFRLNPCLLDSIHQSGVIHAFMRTQQVYLPWGADEFVVLGRQDKNQMYRIEARLVGHEKDKLFYDIFLKDESGAVCAWVKRSTYHRISA